MCSIARWWTSKCWFAIVAALVLSCGGGGSSGFDRSPAELEQARILDSASTLTCVTLTPGLRVCAVGAPVTLPFTPPASGTAIPAEAPLVAIDGIDADCLSDARECALAVSVELGLSVPRDAQLLFAIRPEDLSQPWRTAKKAIRPAEIPKQPVGFVSGFAPGTAVIVAALVYPPGTLPPMLPSGGALVDLLGELDAPLAGVVLGAVVPDF